MKTILISILAFINIAAFSQNNAEQTKIKDYLESTIQNKNTLLLSNISQNVVASDIIKSSLTINTGDKYNNNSIQELYFIKTDK